MSILTVLVPASTSDLTTLAVLKEELGIKNSLQDSKLKRWITEASATIETYLGWSLSKATLQEDWQWANRHSTRYGLVLSRYPVISVTSITADGTAVLDPANYTIDPDKGLIYRLDVSGVRIHWNSLRLSVVYVAGYAAITDIPADIREACLIMLRHRYALGNRDPTIKSESVPGVLTSEYWVGGIGDNPAIPPQAIARLNPFREIFI